jgi:hypothetical protein
MTRGFAFGSKGQGFEFLYVAVEQAHRFDYQPSEERRGWHSPTSTSSTAIARRVT